MAALPVVSGRHAMRAFQGFGWEVARQRGSHIILTKPGSYITLSVPDHREVARGTLRSLLRNAEISVEDFVSALR
jgi:predicted RNA binding protein YcfA (HicA-like mRNA interferase family)